MAPREVVERWVERFNAADADGLAALYHPDAVNHQVTQEPVERRDAIQAMFEREFASADMTCVVEALSTLAAASIRGLRVAAHR
jgi:ketosteroid isomerase-like protein